MYWHDFRRGTSPLAIPIDISPVHRKIVCDILRKYLAASAKVWVFGSRADWTTKNSSDLDLALECESKLDYKITRALEDAFEDSDLPYTVDIVNLNTVNPKFKQIINKNKILLLSTKDKSQNQKNSWKQSPISNVALIIIGGTPSRNTKKYWNGKIPWVTAKDISSTSGRYLKNVQEYITKDGLNSSTTKIMPRGTIIITARGTVGALVQLNEDMAFNQTCYAIIPKNNTIDQDFLYYALKGTVNHAHTLAYGTIFDTITRSTFEDWYIPLPLLSDQRIIAHILGTLDNKIELNRCMDQTLEEISRALFKSWFVDFEPVRAKMDGRWKRRKSLPGLPAHLYDLFPDKLVNSKLGYIPQGWKVNVLDDCFDISMGQSPPSDTYNDKNEGLPFFQGSADFGTRYPNNKKYCTAPTRVAHADDTLVSVRAPVGTINMAWEKCCIGRGVATLRHKTGSRSFTYYFVQSIQHELKQYEQTGTVFGAITKKQLESLPIIEPPVNLIQCFETYVSTLDCRIRQNTLQSRSLTFQRDTLLPKLISGELRIAPPWRNAQK